MKKNLSTLLVVLFATNMMAQSGLTCNDPIPVDSNYQAYVDGPCEIWYTANTYDLPLNVYFLPDAENSTWGPEVYVDFTCTPGVYEDPNIADLVGSMTDFGYELPIELLCDQVVREGRNAYDLNIGKFYRDQLTQFGINYNVQAFVKVTYFESGRISLRPDTLFKNCMENSHYIELGDTLDIEANDSQSVFVAALPDWKNDSIRFVWDGVEPLRMYFATTECNFNPTPTNDYVYTYYDIESGMPLKMYTDQMKEDIDASKDGGIFYVKMITRSAGRLIIEKIPMDPPAGGAIELEYDQPVEVAANDIETIFAMHKTWREATEFIGATNFEMQVSNSHLFDTSISGVILRTYSSSLSDGVHSLGLTSAEMKALTAKAIDNYMYVRFVPAENTVITPTHWDISDCLDNTQAMHADKVLSVSSSTMSNIYRIAYSELEGNNLKIKWDGNANMTVYIGDTCIYSMSTTDTHVIYSKRFTRKGTSTVDVSIVNSWADYVDADGYLYVRFNTSFSSRITFITEKPATPDPINTTITETLCYGESYEWNGQVYATTGEYTQNFTAANGADSIVTLKLTILPEVAPTTEEATIEAGETYTWNGKEYSEAGEYTIILQDKNGCDYQTTLVLTVNEPLSPCLQSSIKLNVGDEVVINLDSAFTVYAIDYAAWMAQPVTLVWTGVEALHTFVAETCVFALAPYNRYVHAYVPVPAQGDSALDMEALAPYVDVDGYLYVRFLTEFEGTLKVGQ